MTAVNTLSEQSFSLAEQIGGLACTLLYLTWKTAMPQLLSFKLQFSIPGFLCYCHSHT